MRGAKLSISATLTYATLRPAPALTVLAGVAFKAKDGLPMKYSCQVSEP